jgi:PKD repeat protein
MLDTEDKLRNAFGVGDDLGIISLVEDGVVDQEDQENWGTAWAEFEYDPFPMAPEAEFSFTVDAERLRVYFFDQSLNSPTAWAWDFGDPGSGAENFSTDANPIHEFTSFGTFKVKLTATNAQGSDGVEHEVTIEDPGLPYVPIHHHVEQGRALVCEQFRIRGAL